MHCVLARTALVPRPNRSRGSRSSLVASVVVIRALGRVGARGRLLLDEDGNLLLVHIGEELIVAEL